MTQRSPLKRIMCVEDDEDIRQIIEIALEQIGQFEVLLCENGNLAVEQVDSFEPDLILLDVMMPGMDGPDTLNAIRSQTHSTNTPVIFMTAKVQPAEIEQYIALGALDVIAKPFDPMTLPEQITAIWER
ncbi:response regulator [Lacimicrobium alkaliphilum]|uniref:Response regulator n=1 Tax=Lacimicrobium alkaliphilum TaxID=1526571 RepID=A0ABQ1RA30_9ALTE|nr:response regulator [Lacimicrobium alkaliphilum]GGD61116.1 response regulator [Lacimicrobium alkaliphilum]